MEKYIDLEKIAAEYDPNKTSPAEQRLADVVVAAIRELAPNAVEQSSKKDHEYGVYTQEELETPLTFQAKADDTKIYFLAYKAREQTRTIEVSTDDGNTWTEFTSETYNGDNNTPIATLNIGQKVLVRGDNPNGFGYYDDDEGPASAGAFRIDGETYVYGNVMSLLNKDSFATMKSVPEYVFTRQFSSTIGNWDNDGTLFSHPTKRLLLPATTLAGSCYSYMFSGCTSLTTAPELPSTTLAEECYNRMFSGCTNLIAAPELPATTLANSCYSSMFYNCTHLIVAPELPATILTNNCYDGMFYNCTSLTSAPELPATTLVTNCYRGMFENCYRINFIKAAFTTTPGIGYTQNWVKNVFPNGLFLKKGTWTTTGNDGIPDGWTSRSY